MRKGATSIETILVLSAVVGWAQLGSTITPAIPTFIYEFFWTFLGAFIVQGFWQLAKRPHWTYAVGISGSSGMLAGATAWLIDWLTRTINRPLGQEGEFMVAIIVGLYGIEKTLAWGEKLLSIKLKVEPPKE